jgi:hypothetical protein
MEAALAEPKYFLFQKKLVPPHPTKTMGCPAHPPIAAGVRYKHLDGGGSPCWGCGLGVSNRTNFTYGWIPHDAGFGFLDLTPSILLLRQFWD